MSTNTAMLNSNNNNNNSSNNTNTSASIQQQPPALRCPRCDSSNTKFCYYNNYSLLQPRYFCKSCRRYWTKGGTLRNVPVGGGCRKNKRQQIGHARQSRPTDSSSIPIHFLSGHGQFEPAPSFPFSDHHTSRASGPSLNLLGHIGGAAPDQHPPPFLCFNPSPTDDRLSNDALNRQSLNPIIPSDHANTHCFFSRQLASYLPSSLASQYLSNVNSINPMQTPGYSHDYLGASSLSASDHQTITHSASSQGNAPSHESGFKAFSVAFENPFNVVGQMQQQQCLPNWQGGITNTMTKSLVHEHNVLTDHNIPQLNARNMEDQSCNMDLEAGRFNRTRPDLPCPKTEEQSWDHTANVNAGNPSAYNFWNHGSWQDMSSGYNPSADHHHPLM